jgi:hypothetical protein
LNFLIAQNASLKALQYHLQLQLRDQKDELDLAIREMSRRHEQELRRFKQTGGSGTSASASSSSSSCASASWNV